MKEFFYTLFGLMLFISSSFSQSTFQVKGRDLYDPCGEKVVLRGINEMFIWSGDPIGEKTMPEIAKTGANVVRIVWLSDDENPAGSAENLDKVITNCISNKMIPMPELHGATGKWDKLQSQVDYWVKPEVVKVLKKHESYLLLNIANEVGGFEVTAKTFKKGYKEAIKRIRGTGLKCPLVIDASGWGQDTDILQATGKYLISKDPEKNLLFSVHMWWAAEDGSQDRIISELEESVNLELPLIVGEFAPMGPGCKEYIDYQTIIKECQRHQIGWMSWSWGLVNNADCKDMDMTSDELAGKFEGLQGWGLDAAVENEFSIKNTAVRTTFIQNQGRCE